MAFKSIEIKPSGFKPGATSVWVTIDDLDDGQYETIVQNMTNEISSGKPISDAIANSYVFAVRHAPKANPSDLWQHVIYRSLLAMGFSDQQWKRISGYSLERAFVEIYFERLSVLGLRLRIMTKPEAKELLQSLGLRGKVKDAKVDCIIEKVVDGEYKLFAGLHVKASLAERIQDDVPASLALMDNGYLSLMITLDSKSYPPPHGSGVNFGELGGRTNCSDSTEKIKRQYIEVDGQFSALFSYNLRTPPSGEKTKSGKKIYTQLFNAGEEDHLVNFLKKEVKKASKVAVIP